MLSKASGKSKHGGAGGRANKSHNAQESFVARKKRAEKFAREEEREEEAERQRYMAEMDAHFAPVDKKDMKRITRLEA